MEKLLIAVTFFFKPDRLKYLNQIAHHFPHLCHETKVIIVTNTNDPGHHQLIKQAVVVDIEIVVPMYLGHPYLLTWVHLDCFRKYFLNDSLISHFCYLEDDIELKLENIKYWIKARKDLQQIRLIPSFLRYEFKHGETIMRSSDVTLSLQFEKLPRFEAKDAEYCYVNLPLPYQGMYLLDRELAEEHFFGPSSSPDFEIWGVAPVWGIREKATQGLTFANVPRGCVSRNFLGFNKTINQIDSGSLIHHTPNNYADNPNSRFGKIPIETLIKK
jgi:hypothetical protein